jgi:hypothetical protein
MMPPDVVDLDPFGRAVAESSVETKPYKRYAYDNLNR